jgi:hypothetical protein
MQLTDQLTAILWRAGYAVEPPSLAAAFQVERYARKQAPGQRGLFNEADHPRGKPDNAGQFTEKESGQKATPPDAGRGVQQGRKSKGEMSTDEFNAERQRLTDEFKRLHAEHGGNPSAMRNPDVLKAWRELEDWGDVDIGHKPAIARVKQEKEHAAKLAAIPTITYDDITSEGWDMLHAGLATEAVARKMAVGMEGIEGREYGIMERGSGKWQMASRAKPKDQAQPDRTQQAAALMSNWHPPEDATPAPTGERATFTPIKGGMLFHGSTAPDDAEYINADADGVVWMTDSFDEAEGYARGGHLGGAKQGTPRVIRFDVGPGEMVNITDEINEEITEGDGKFKAIFDKARQSGAKYAYIEHPSFYSDRESQRVIVALDPDDQLPPARRGWTLDGRRWRNQNRYSLASSFQSEMSRRVVRYKTTKGAGFWSQFTEGFKQGLGGGRFEEQLHPRGGKGTKKGGKFVKKGSGGGGPAAAKPGKQPKAVAPQPEGKQQSIVVNGYKYDVAQHGKNWFAKSSDDKKAPWRKVSDKHVGKITDELSRQQFETKQRAADQIKRRQASHSRFILDAIKAGPKNGNALWKAMGIPKDDFLDAYFLLADAGKIQQSDDGAISLIAKTPKEKAQPKQSAKQTKRQQLNELLYGKQTPTGPKPKLAGQLTKKQRDFYAQAITVKEMTPEQRAEQTAAELAKKLEAATRSKEAATEWTKAKNQEAKQTISRVAAEHQLPEQALMGQAEQIAADKNIRIGDWNDAYSNAISQSHLTEQDVADIENAGFDYAGRDKLFKTHPELANKLNGFEATARSVAASHPGLIGNYDFGQSGDVDTNDLSENLWDMLRNGKQREFSPYDEDIAQEAASKMLSATKPKEPEYEELDLTLDDEPENPSLDIPDWLADAGEEDSTPRRKTDEELEMEEFRRPGRPIRYAFDFQAEWEARAVRYARKAAKDQRGFVWTEEDESKHPRDEDGKFAEKGSGGEKSPYQQRLDVISSVLGNYIDHPYTAEEVARTIGGRWDTNSITGKIKDEMALGDDEAKTVAREIVEALHEHYKQQGREFPHHMDWKRTPEQITIDMAETARKNKEEKKKENMAAVAFGEKHWKEPPPPTNVTPKQYAAMQIKQRLVEVQKDYDKIAAVNGAMHRLENDRSDEAYEERIKLVAKIDSPAFRKLCQKYPYQWNAEGVDLRKGSKGYKAVAYWEAGEVVAKVKKELEDRLTDGDLEYYTGQSGPKWNPTREHAELIEKAVSYGGNVPNEVVRAYAYENWMPSIYLNQLRKEDIVDSWEKYSEGKVHQWKRDELLAAQKHYEPQIAAMMENVAKTYPKEVDHEASEVRWAEAKHSDLLKKIKGNEASPEIAKEFEGVVSALSETRQKYDKVKREAGQKWMESLLPKETADVSIEISDHMTPEGLVNVGRGLKFLQKAIGKSHGKIVAKITPIDPARSRGGRAYASGNEMALTPNEAAWVVIHEFGHILDNQQGKALAQMSKTFGIESIKASKQKIAWLGGGHEPDEFGAKDKLVDGYAGKWYEYDSSEVLSMGLQSMYEDPIGFYRDCPDHFKYTMAAIHGLIL